MTSMKRDKTKKHLIIALIFLILYLYGVYLIGGGIGIIGTFLLGFYLELNSMDSNVLIDFYDNHLLDVLHVLGIATLVAFVYYYIKGFKGYLKNPQSFSRGTLNVLHAIIMLRILRRPFASIGERVFMDLMAFLPATTLELEVFVVIARTGIAGIFGWYILLFAKRKRSPRDIIDYLLVFIIAFSLVANAYWQRYVHINDSVDEIIPYRNVDINSVFTLGLPLIFFVSFIIYYNRKDDRIEGIGNDTPEKEKREVLHDF